MLTVREILFATKGKLISGNQEDTIENFSKDTREIKKGDMYIPIVGENFDGHAFINKAFELGAKATFTQIDIDVECKDKIIIKVDNTLEALQKLATYYREKLNIPIIAITGSVGKTSTKDMIASVVSQKYKTLKTEGNYNNHIGVPLTVLKIKEHEAAVIEMGMNNFKEIEKLTNIVKPNIAVITNIGTAHIGNLGSRENILKAKMEILDGLKEDGTLIINKDNDMLNKVKISNKYNLYSYSVDDKSSDLQAYNIKLLERTSNFNIDIDNKTYLIEVPVAGVHFVYNALCAISVGLKLGIDINKIIEGLKNFSLTKKRMDIIELKENIKIINDTYNASFDSIKASLEVLKNMECLRRIVVLGDVLELGEFAEEIHKKIGREVVKNNVDILITVGRHSENVANEAIKLGMKSEEVFHFTDNKDVLDKLKETLNDGDILLIKGSRAMKLDEVVDKLINKE